jgi:hypothetical protein
LLSLSANKRQLFYCEETASLNFAVNVYQSLVLTFFPCQILRTCFYAFAFMPLKNEGAGDMDARIRSGVPIRELRFIPEPVMPVRSTMTGQGEF